MPAAQLATATMEKPFNTDSPFATGMTDSTTIKPILPARYFDESIGATTEIKQGTGYAPYAIFVKPD